MQFAPLIRNELTQIQAGDHEKKLKEGRKKRKPMYFKSKKEYLCILIQKKKRIKEEEKEKSKTKQDKSRQKGRGEPGKKEKIFLFLQKTFEKTRKTKKTSYNLSLNSYHLQPNITTYHLPPRNSGDGTGSQTGRMMNNMTYRCNWQRGRLGEKNVNILSQ